MGKECDFGVIRKKELLPGTVKGKFDPSRNIKRRVCEDDSPGVPELSLKRNKRIFRLYPGRMV